MKQEQTRVQAAIHDHIDRHPGLNQDHDWLRSIPAVGDKTAQRLLAVLHRHDFTSADQVTAFSVWSPSNANRAAACIAAPACPKPTQLASGRRCTGPPSWLPRHNPHIRTLYQRLLARGKAKMAALGAAMRKLVQRAFGVLKHQQPYQIDWTPVP